jgi:hypothetical protein
MTAITLSALAEELDRTKIALMHHWRKLGITPQHRQIDGAHGLSYTFTAAEAAAIRKSVQTAKRGRPHGAKDTVERKTRSDAGKPRRKKKISK